MIKVIRYECEHCGEIGEKEYIEEHENNCIRNPKYRDCKTCDHAFRGINNPDSIYCIERNEKLDPLTYDTVYNCYDYKIII